LDLLQITILINHHITEAKDMHIWLTVKGAGGFLWILIPFYETGAVSSLIGGL